MTSHVHLLREGISALNQSGFFSQNASFVGLDPVRGNGSNQSATAADSVTWDMVVQANIAIGIIYPILLACCTVGNGLNLIVLAKEKKKGSPNSYMIAVAVADIFVL